jgi:non-homologous end joining protein Ku
LLKKKNNIFYIKTPHNYIRINHQNIHSIKKKNKKKINLNFFLKYAAPFLGIVWLWKNFFLQRKTKKTSVYIKIGNEQNDTLC